MKLKTKRCWLTVFVLACATLVGYVAYQLRPITPPEGDGVFQDLSGWIGPIPYPGYHIKFPKFDLSHPFHAQYRLSRLPNVGDRCGLYLVLIDAKGEWPWDRDYSKVGGRLALRLSKSDGKDVVSVDGPLGKYVWWGFMNKHGLYQDHSRSHFYPDRFESYTLTITYEPAPELFGINGYVYLQTGSMFSGSPDP